MERFGDPFGTMFVSFSDIFSVIFASILSQHVANKDVQNHKETPKECKRKLPKKQLLSSCHLALKSSLANVNELSGPC